jgi:UDP-N-acetylglucosamine 4,6-dehydratase (inverting)
MSKPNLLSRCVLITGGTGSLGQALTQRLLNDPTVHGLVIYSRDEQKQHEMAQRFPTDRYPQMRYFIGDVRDFRRVKRAFMGVDDVIHAAAMKHVHIAEYNPDECVNTNVGGAQNVIDAALETQVKRVVALSTDKACAPINLYGATKLTSDKLFVAANNIRGSRDVCFSVVRYGNVMGSNGSVIPFFMKRRDEGVLPITDPSMTRFNITLSASVDMVVHALEAAWGGEILVPKLASYRILDLAKAVGPNCLHKVIGIRPGEKIHEEMITAADSQNTYDLGRYFAILPQLPPFDIEAYLKHHGAVKVPHNFSYGSKNNAQWETPSSLRALIRKHIDPDFQAMPVNVPA